MISLTTVLVSYMTDNTKPEKQYICLKCQFELSRNNRILKRDIELFIEIIIAPEMQPRTGTCFREIVYVLQKWQFILYSGMVRHLAANTHTCRQE